MLLLILSFCDKTAPIAAGDQSVCRMYGKLMSGRLRTGGDVSLPLSRWKADSHSTDQGESCILLEQIIQWLGQSSIPFHIVTIVDCNANE